VFYAIGIYIVPNRAVEEIEAIVSFLFWESYIESGIDVLL